MASLTIHLLIANLLTNFGSTLEFPFLTVDEIFEDEFFQLCSKTFNLKLNQETRCIEENFLNSSKLDCLDLSSNNIEKLHENSLNNLPNLRYANFENNCFDTNEILASSHDLLEVLILDDSGTTYQDRQSLVIKGNFPKLRKLHLSNGRLSSLKMASDLPSLTHLDVSNNYISNKDAFKTFPLSLEYLNIEDNDLPALDVKDFTKLKYLFARGTGDHLNSISLKNLASLKFLSLAFCGLVDPVRISLSNTPNITSVDLSENRIMTFDFDLIFRNVKHLHFLNLSGNHELTRISSSFQSYLMRLDISSTDMSNLYGLPKTLRHLTYRNSTSAILRIKEYCSDDPRTCGELLHLDLSQNRITSLDELTFRNLENLRSLNLSNSSIVTIASGTLDNLINLQYLNLECNAIDNFPKISKKSKIDTLLLNSNKLENLKAGTFDNLNSLKNLFLHNNSISEIESRAFDGLNVLQVLTLTNNQLKNLPEDWSLPLESLQSLDLSGNVFLSLDSLHLSPKSPLKNLYLSEQFSMIEIFAVKNVPKNLTFHVDAGKAFAENFVIETKNIYSQ